jgi:ribosomal protein S18 acetylase RimI-like enzyme
MAVLRLVSPTHPAAAPLLTGLRLEYTAFYGPEVATELDRHSPVEFLPPSGVFLIVEEDGVTVAGGALRRLADGVGEIKRMWTAPRVRGRGYARLVLAELEAAALRRGYRRLRLETGTPQRAAIGLYASSGYERVENYGAYAADPRCLSFEKLLDGRDDIAPDPLDGREVVVREVLEHHPVDSGGREMA